MDEESTNNNLYIVRCNECDFEKRVDNATYALNTLHCIKTKQDILIVTSRYQDEIPINGI
jgi:hypothetical protein